MRTPSFSRALALAAALLALGQAAAACQSCGDDTPVIGSHKADGGANADGGNVHGQDGLGDDGGATVDGASGSDAGVSDAANADASQDSSADASADAADATTGSTPCQTNATCQTDQLCGLFYNGVQELLGDPQPDGSKKLPGWANVCVARPATGAAEGAACDPFVGDADAALPACVNQSACMQGLCTALCQADGDCPKGSICGVTESAVAVKASGAPAQAWLPVDICQPMPGPGQACGRDGDCGAGQVCRPFTTRAGAGLTAGGRCVTPEAGKAVLGASCGVAAAATGLGKLCASTLCLYEQPAGGGGGIAGTCSAVCSGQADCPASASWAGVAYPTTCAAIRSHRGLDGQTGGVASHDDVYWPHCVLVNQQSSLQDCAATRACAGTEACLPYPIAWGPDLGAKVEYRCVQQKTTTLPAGPTLDDGAACDPSKVEAGCKGGLCLADSKGGGLCSRVCKDNAGCGAGQTCKDHVLIARAEAGNAAVAQACKP